MDHFEGSYNSFLDLVKQSFLIDYLHSSFNLVNVTVSNNNIYFLPIHSVLRTVNNLRKLCKEY